ncbi:MAG: hypothetical protein QOF92_1119, partial [Pseudonocardiales bacterium]|nr:hypothetical protein [Pseudonocardiales bacterium]
MGHQAQQAGNHARAREIYADGGSRPEIVHSLGMADMTDAQNVEMISQILA